MSRRKRKNKKQHYTIFTVEGQRGSGSKESTQIREEKESTTNQGFQKNSVILFDYTQYVAYGIREKKGADQQQCYGKT